MARSAVVHIAHRARCARNRYLTKQLLYIILIYMPFF